MPVEYVTVLVPQHKIFHGGHGTKKNLPRWTQQDILATTTNFLCVLSTVVGWQHHGHRIEVEEVAWIILHLIVRDVQMSQLLQLTNAKWQRAEAV